MAKSFAINFATTEEKRRQFNSLLAGNGLNTKDVMNLFVDKLISTPAETLKFLGLENE